MWRGPDLKKVAPGGDMLFINDLASTATATGNSYEYRAYFFMGRSSRMDGRSNDKNDHLSGSKPPSQFRVSGEHRRNAQRSFGYGLRCSDYARVNRRIHVAAVYSRVLFRGRDYV
jgi:hypothetical protein